MLLCSSSECWCSTWSSFGFIIYECMMSFWVYPMCGLWFSEHYSCVVSFSQTSECCWINFFQICIGLCAWERIVVMHLQVHVFGRFAWYRTVLNLICVHLWFIRTISSLFLCFLTFHLLYCSQYKACAELNILTIRMFHLFHLGWFLRLVFDVINPNSENITEVQWLQHLGWYSYWNIPSTSMFIVLNEH
jgi:hypothetical protein